MSAPSYQVVVSFPVAGPSDPAAIEAYVRKHLGDLQGLSIAIRKIGASGESSVDEGRWDAPPSPQDGPGTPKGVV